MERESGQECFGRHLRNTKPKKHRLTTSVKCGSVINICGNERRFSLSPHRIVPHPPDTTLEYEIFQMETK